MATEVRKSVFQEEGVMSYIAMFCHYKYTRAKLTGKIKKLQKKLNNSAYTANSQAAISLSDPLFFFFSVDPSLFSSDDTKIPGTASHCAEQTVHSLDGHLLHTQNPPWLSRIAFPRAKPGLSLPAGA